MTKEEQQEIKIKMEASLRADCKYMWHSAADFHKSDSNRPLHKEEFEFRFMTDTYNKNDAFILAAVFELSCATPGMVEAFLSNKSRRMPVLSIPELNISRIKTRLEFLTRQGLLFSEVFTTQRKNVVSVYKCTLFGFQFFKNQLESSFIYDDYSVIRGEYEVYRRLNANAFALAFLERKECIDYHLYCRGTSFTKENGLFYFEALMKTEKGNRLFILEPILFEKNSEYVLEEDMSIMLRYRLKKLLSASEREGRNTPITVILAVENVAGIKKLLPIIDELAILENVEVLFSSENCLMNSKGNLDECFFTVRRKDKQTMLSCIYNKWIS